MTARKYTLRLYQHGRLKGEKSAVLDPSSNARLRALLDEWAEAKANGMPVHDYSDWHMVVHTLGGGRVHATVRITGDGTSAVTR